MMCTGTRRILPAIRVVFFNNSTNGAKIVRFHVFRRINALSHGKALSSPFSPGFHPFIASRHDDIRRDPFTLRTTAVDTVKTSEWCTAPNPAQAIPGEVSDRKFGLANDIAVPSFLPKVGSPDNQRATIIPHRGSEDFRDAEALKRRRPAPPAGL